MKTLIYYEKSDLKPVGGPSGYLYNVYQEIRNQGIKEIEFLDSKYSRIQNLIRRLFYKLQKKILLF